jgi:hypothetical protein
LLVYLPWIGFAVSEQYNALAIQNGWEYVEGAKYMHEHNYINCTVAGILKSTYGKYQADDQSRTIIMEYDNLLEALLPNLYPTAPP